MSFRTDLAVESAQSHTERLPHGITQTQRTFRNLSISCVKIENETAAQLLEKPIGKYVTITMPPLYSGIEPEQDEIEVIAQEIKAMLPPGGLVLIVGLGNNDITPDAIGPRAARQILATRHIGEETAKQNGLEGLRPTAVVAPGVLGQTGIETCEIVGAVAGDIKPVAAIVIDALAARAASRLGTTIQIADSGISPGSGVMNRRKELSIHTLGIPVVSIGVPTVIDTGTIVRDVLEENKNCGEILENLFRDTDAPMMITPREIDLLISHACKVISMAVNIALHPSLSFDDIGYLSS